MAQQDGWNDISPRARGEIDRIFADHQKAVDKIFDEFSADVKADIRAFAGRLVNVICGLLVLAGIAGVVIAHFIK